MYSIKSKNVSVKNVNVNFRGFFFLANYRFSKYFAERFFIYLACMLRKLINSFARIISQIISYLKKGKNPLIPIHFEPLLLK